MVVKKTTGNTSNRLEQDILALEDRLLKAKVIISEEKEKWKEAVSPGKYGTRWRSARVLKAKRSFREIPPLQWSKNDVAEWLQHETLVDAANVCKWSGAQLLGANPCELKKHFQDGIVRPRQFSTLLTLVARLRKAADVVTTIASSSSSSSPDLPPVHSPLPQKKKKRKEKRASFGLNLVVSSRV